MNLEPIQLYPSQKKVVEQLNSTNKNSLVVMPTGGGKTLIVAQLFSQVLKQNNTRCLFLAPTNILVNQHQAQLSRFLGDVVFKVTPRTLQIPRSKRVLICTGHYGKLLFQRCSFKPEHFNLISFDEAHKASSAKSPYTQVAKLSSCRIVAVTASVGSSSKTSKIIKNLNVQNVIYGESPFSFKKQLIKTSLNLEHGLSLVRSFLLKNNLKYEPILRLLDFPASVYLLRDVNIIHLMLRNRNRILSKLQGKSKSLTYSYYKFFQIYYCVYLYLFQDYRTFQRYLNKVNVKYKLASLKFFETLLELPFENPKFVYMKNLLLTKQKDSSLIVFFENYETACSFRDYLKQLNSYKVAVLGGKSKLRPKERDLIISKLNLQNVDCVLCTSVVEQGVNIRAADRVILYTPISDQIKLIQRKGRTGRYADGTIEVLYYNDTFQQNVAKRIL